MSLSFDLLGNPSLVTYVAVYPSSADIPSRERILERAEALIERYPLLKGCVLDARTTNPKWGILPRDALIKAMTSSVHDVPIQDVAAFGYSADEKSQPAVSRTLENIFNRELHDKQTIRVSGGGFLWRVVRYLSDPDATGTPDHRPAYIALTCNHVISDGRSGQRLLEALLSDTELESTKEKPKIAPSMQDTINCRPSLGFMLHQVWYEVIVPKLPWFLERRLRVKPCWPAVPPYGGNLVRIEEGVRLAFHHIHLSTDSLKRLKHTGKANGIKTLHPTLQVAAIVALWIAVGNGAKMLDESDRQVQSLRISHATAASHCSTELGHPAITGNYIGHLLSTSTVNGEVNFWQAARDHAKWLHSPGSRRQGCQVMGSLRYIPDGINDSSAETIRPTGWESFFLDRAAREPADSFSSSNLGFYALPPGSTRLAWSQTTVLGTPIQINLIGHSAGIDIDISRPTGAWIDEFGYEPSEHFAAIYETVLTMFTGALESADRSETQSNLRFSDIRRMTGM